MAYDFDFRPFITNLLPCFARICTRAEEPVQVCTQSTSQLLACVASIFKELGVYGKGNYGDGKNFPCHKPIEIIDIECVLLSFLSQKFVSTKWRIQKGIFTRSRLLRQGISRGSGE